MPWEPERNIRSLSPHGLKESSGFVTRGPHDATNSVGCSEMGPGILPSGAAGRHEIEPLHAAGCG
jgi:hypothetical protein